VSQPERKIRLGTEKVYESGLVADGVGTGLYIDCNMKIALYNEKIL